MLVNILALCIATAFLSGAFIILCGLGMGIEAIIRKFQKTTETLDTPVKYTIIDPTPPSRLYDQNIDGYI